MPKSGKIVLNLVDAYGRNLEESVDISLKPQGPGEKRFFKDRDAKKRLRISRPQGLYRLHIDPPSYLPIHRFIQMPPSGETTSTISFAVDPQKVVKINIPKYTTLAPEIKTLLAASKSVRPYGTNSGAKLYKLLDNPRKAGFFNIIAKAKNTFFSNGKTVFDHIRQLTELRGDRFFAVVDQELEVDIKNSVADDLFHEASDALHDPPEGFRQEGELQDRRPLWKPSGVLFRQRRRVASRHRHRRRRGSGACLPGGPKHPHRKTDAPIRHSRNPSDSPGNQSPVTSFPFNGHRQENIAGFRRPVSSAPSSRFMEEASSLVSGPDVRENG